VVVASFGVILTDPALGAALIQRPTIEERDRSTVFWLAACIGGALTVLGLAVSGLVADLFGEPRVQELFAVASISCLVVGFAVVPRALLTRKLAYRALEIREMTALVVGGATAVALALAGLGPWAIVANLLAYATTSTVLAWILVDWRPRAAFSLQRARDLGGFSSRVFGALLLDWGSQNLDKALVGRFVGASALGAYSLAWNVMRMPVTLVSGTVNQALTPAYSRIQRDKDRLERVWLRNKRLSYALIAPALAALVVVAPDLVRVAFGEKWEDMIVPLQILCVGALAGAFGTMNWSVLQARGEAAVLLRLTLLSSVVTWVAIAAGLYWGIVGVAAFYAGARWLLVVPTTLMTARGVSFDFWATLRAGAGVLPLVAAAALVGFVAREALLETEVATVVRLVVVTLLVLVAYLGLVVAFLPAIVRDVVQVVESRRRRGRPPPTAQADPT
jgi:O-antigen/teichoic acid export membrane protein